MLDTLNEALKSLDKIQGLSAVALVALGCIVIGYVLRFVKSFPNNGIPVAVILMGALMMLILADPRATTMPARIWTMRNLLIGLIIGFLSWMGHYFIIRRLEMWIVGKFGNSNTDFFRRKAGQTDKPDDNPKP